jgi:hypothetical protein
MDIPSSVIPLCIIFVLAVWGLFEEDYSQKWKCAEDGYMTRTPVLALTKDFSGSLQVRGSVQKVVQSVPQVNEEFAVGEVGDLPRSVIHGTNGDSDVIDKEDHVVPMGGRNRGKGKQTQSNTATEGEQEDNNHNPPPTTDQAELASSHLCR